MNQPRPNLSPEEQIEILASGTADLIRREELLAKLRRGKPLLVKAGFDPSAPDIHLGHMVVMRKMRQFQELGHQATFVVGDFTARIGDPSGRSRTRPPLSNEQIHANAETYRQQAAKLLDPDRTRFEYNSSWLDPLGADGLIRLAGKITVARILERDDFSKRYKEGHPIGLHELMYPLAQAYDSVHLQADVELGGTDQTFNLLVGRDLMREYALEPQVILTTPLLVGLDGTEKMSKSLGNYIGVEETGDAIYGKVMSLSDELMWSYWTLLSDLSPAGVSERQAAVEAGKLHPMRVKQDLARHLVATLHGETAAQAAEEAFNRVFRSREQPTDMPETTLPASAEPIRVIRLLVDAGLAASMSEARRLVGAGAVRIDGARVADIQEESAAEAGRSYEIKVGKHRFARVRFTDDPPAG